ncbi:hypothetical protein GFGA_1d0303 [Gluconobacter frateurii NBRC 103465]|nr:hypothetical protein GFGA_1d0303 [Gluconobacter frateurii NBRC 103465]
MSTSHDFLFILRQSCSRRQHPRQSIYCLADHFTRRKLTSYARFPPPDPSDTACSFHAGTAPAGDRTGRPRSSTGQHRGTGSRYTGDTAQWPGRDRTGRRWPPLFRRCSIMKLAPSMLPRAFRVRPTPLNT